ncbi:hypothetical protein GCM10010306_103860 [Streptomyces umbrinus]|nr:hypothetical protein GCM10010306_103860 [Streptomyces umbrinus]
MTARCAGLRPQGPQHGDVLVRRLRPVCACPARQGRRGQDLAIFNVAGKLPESLVPFMGPALLALGGYTALFLFLGAAGLLGALACFRLPEVGREHETSRWSAPITRG